MYELLMTIVAIMIAAPLALQFVNDVKKEIAAHGNDMNGDEDGNR